MHGCARTRRSGYDRSLVADFVNRRHLHHIRVNIRNLRIPDNLIAIGIFCKHRVNSVFFCCKTAGYYFLCCFPYRTVCGLLSLCPLQRTDAGAVACLYLDFYRLVGRNRYDRGNNQKRNCRVRFFCLDKFCQIISKILTAVYQPLEPVLHHGIGL